jgi:hypothetical protein
MLLSTLRLHPCGGEPVRSIASIALVLLGLALARPASAQVFGQFTGAEPLAPNEHLFGGYFHASGNEAGLQGQLRLSFYPGIDFGFQGGVLRRDLAIGDRTTVRLGLDVKGRVHAPSERLPLTLSLGGALQVENGDDLSVLTISPTLVGSHTFGETTKITPYGRVGVAFAKMTLSDDEDTDFSIPLRVGSEFLMAGNLGLVVEIQANMDDRINDDLALTGGVNVRF